MANKKLKLVEITRSFSYKLNMGNYQTADFFCSQKAETNQKDIEKTSELLFDFCRKEVEKSVKKYTEISLEETQEAWDEKKEQIYQEDSLLDDINKELLEVDKII